MGHSPSSSGKRSRVGLVPTINNDETFRVGDWRWFKWNSTGCAGSGKFYAGEVLSIHGRIITWQWFSDRTRSSRTVDQLRKETAPTVTQEESQKLVEDSSLHREEVLYILQNVNIQTLNASLSQDHQSQGQSESNQSQGLDLSFEGFRNIGNSRHWNKLIKEWLPTFDPTKFLTRKISTISPKGTARPLWIDCVKAVTHLLAQIENRIEGVFQPSELYDQLLMWTRCMPAILLRAKPGDTHNTIMHLIGR